MMIVSTHTEGEIIDPESRAELNTDSGMWVRKKGVTLHEEVLIR